MFPTHLFAGEAMGKCFYFTAHASDLSRRRLPEGCRVMVVAAAFWDDGRKRFRAASVPAGHVASVAVDSGGFTAARRWGQYPFTPRQYAEWARRVGERAPLDFVAVMDYACEPSVNREVLATNRERIDATHRNELACWGADRWLPWLPVLQGDSLAERGYDLDRRVEIGLPLEGRLGVGSVCGRERRAVREVLAFYAERLPLARLHAFGMDARVLDSAEVWPMVESWDSYAWNWPKGRRNHDRPPEYERRSGESYTRYTGRLARVYYRDTVLPRLSPPAAEPALF